MFLHQEFLLQHAREFLTSKEFRPMFTETEKKYICPFFTSVDGRVYFTHSLPESVLCVLFSMFSRIKNLRGLRGVWVDSFLPLFFASTLQEVETAFGGSTEKFLHFYEINSLEKFLTHSEEARQAANRFLKAIDVDPNYIEEFSAAPKVKVFLATHKDGYGHNSIGRVAGLHICFENISILAAKSIEWGRMGTGYIELSTRYVDMSGKEMYPIENELAWYGVDAGLVRSAMESSFDYYRAQQGEKFSGIFPEFLREHYKNFRNVNKFENGVVGETCDVLGNFLPCATLTSLGVAMSGESFPDLLKHLMLDNTPENLALVELILEEAKKIGGDQFSRHFEPSEWKKISWEYLDSSRFRLFPPFTPLYPSEIKNAFLPPNEYAKRALYEGFRGQPFFANMHDFNAVIKKLKVLPRGEFDKLPNHFEKISGVFSGIMSFRSWRDLQRQQLSTHYRTHVKPIGFYLYDKPAPGEFFTACQNVWKQNYELYLAMRSKNVPPEIMQYPLAMGNLVGFEFAGNLAQLEFCIWQRSKFSVNHEVRQMFLQIYKELQRVYPWWKDVSRADTIPAYVFARTERGIPLVRE
ncbi:MAG: FAD-dependent thymidylate synthase [Candidatus Sungbacteria bacterium]|nr:FAD-dependent thymidylate synthase [Candidatus Sungbacteria bacterium]